MIRSKRVTFDYLLTFIVVIFAMTFSACSIRKQKDEKSRFFLNFGTRYNILYNGNALLEEGERAMNETITDNYQQELSVFKEPTEASIQQVKPLMDSLIGKSTRIINEKTKSKYIDDAYLLKGKANYYLGNYFMANEFFDYILKNLPDDPRVRQQALIWQANALIQLDNIAQVPDLLDQAFKNSGKEDHYNGLLNAVQAKYYLYKNDKSAAIDFLSKAIEAGKRKKNRLRWHYLLGQLLFEKGNNASSYSHFSRVVKSNESYEMAFYANLYRIEILNKDNPGVETRVGLLTKLLRDNKNKHYKGQIYQRIGDAYVNAQQIEEAIHQYKLAITNSQNNNYQQSINYLTLADLFFDQGVYPNARLYYDSTMQVLSPDNIHYEAVRRKAANLSALIAQLTVISYQDTLIELAALSPSAQEIAIDSILTKRLALIQSTPEDKAQETRQELPLLVGNTTRGTQNQNPSGVFYFNNPSAITQGFSTFKRQWGNRQLADNWRYSNKNQLQDINNPQSEASPTAISAENAQERETALMTTWREQYVEDIPDTEEKLVIANDKIKQAYFALAEIYQNALYDEAEAAKTYEVLLERFPETDNIDLIYYHLYRLYADEVPDKSAFYRQKLIKEYPDSKYTKVITDPQYYKKQDELRQQFNDYFSSIYQLFNEKKYNEIIMSVQSVLRENPYEALDNTAQLAYIQALAIGRTRSIEQFKDALTTLIDHYPHDELVVPLAKQHIAYIDAHPDEFEGRTTALEDIDHNRERFIGEPIVTPWPELAYDRQYTIPQYRKDYDQVNSKTSLAIGENLKSKRGIQQKQLTIGEITENRHENSYRNLDLLPDTASYYFVINVMHGSVNLNPSRYGIGQFNRGQYPHVDLKHQLKNVAGENQLIYIGVFSSYEEVAAYANKIKPLLSRIMKIPEDAYNSFIITEDNFNTLTDFDKIDDYHTTYTQEPQTQIE